RRSPLPRRTPKRKKRRTRARTRTRTRRCSSIRCSKRRCSTCARRSRRRPATSCPRRAGRKVWRTGASAPWYTTRRLPSCHVPGLMPPFAFRSGLVGLVLALHLVELDLADDRQRKELVACRDAGEEPFQLHPLAVDFTGGQQGQRLLVALLERQRPLRSIALGGGHLLQLRHVQLHRLLEEHDLGQFLAARGAVEDLKLGHLLGRLLLAVEIDGDLGRTTRGGRGRLRAGETDAPDAGRNSAEILDGSDAQLALVHLRLDRQLVRTGEARGPGQLHIAVRLLARGDLDGRGLLLVVVVDAAEPVDGDQREDSLLPDGRVLIAKDQRLGPFRFRPDRGAPAAVAGLFFVLLAGLPVLLRRQPG